jgi:uncharacterized membrane protein
MELRASTMSTYSVEESQAASLVPSKKLALFGLVGLSAVLIVSVLLKPSTGEYFTVCGFKNFTGLPCPGCGLTHSFCALAKGSIGEAFEFNLLGPLLYAVLVLVWVRSACVLFNRENAVRVFDRIAERFNVVRAFAYAFVVYGTARIVYLLVFQSAAYQESPLSRLIARLIH